MCVFNAFLCVWDQISVTIFARKDRKPNVIKPNAKQNRFLDSHDFFLLFSSAYFLDIMSPSMFPQVLAKYF